MKKLILSLSLSAFLFSLTSCKKNEGESKQPNNTCSVSTWTQKHSDNTTSQLNYTYDANGNISKITTLGEIWAREITIQYSSNKVLMKSGLEYEFLTDNNGRIIKYVRDEFSFIDCKYSPDGYLTEIKDTQSGGTIYTYYLTYTNGNLVKVSNNKSGDELWEEEYTYYVDKEPIVKFDLTLNRNILELLDIEQFDFNPAIFPTSFFGKQSKNLLKSMLSTSSGNYKYHRSNLNYQYDSTGKPTKMTVDYTVSNDKDKNYINHGEFEAVELIYNCK